MQKNYFHNNKSINENNNIKTTTQTSEVGLKKVVDVNILLNRVKIEKKNETKKKIIFFSFTTLSLLMFGVFIIILK